MANLKETMKTNVNKIGLKLNKNKPTILMVIGVAGVAGGFVAGCAASTKVPDIIEEHNEKVEEVHERDERLDNGEEIMLKDGSFFTKEDNQRELFIAYRDTAFKFIRLYAPSVLVTLTSIGCITYSHKEMTDRNSALATAYVAIDKGFKSYRKNVKERFGDEVDKELRFGVKEKEVEQTVTDKKGKEHVEKSTLSDITEHNDFSRFFDETCNGWTKNPALNLSIVKQQQDFANEKLKSQGFLFLNDVYELLGIPKTPDGQLFGWIYDEENPNGDNYVDFGVWNPNNTATRRFVNGYESVILLDFNVDGPIYNMI